MSDENFFGNMNNPSAIRDNGNEVNETEIQSNSEKAQAPVNPNSIDKEALELKARQEAIDAMRSKMPTSVAMKFIIRLPVGIPVEVLSNSSFIPDDVPGINFVEVRRMNKRDRTEHTRFIASASQKTTQYDITTSKMKMLITNIGYTPTSYDKNIDRQSGDYESPLDIKFQIPWNKIPVPMRDELLGHLDILDEDEILEGMQAVEEGYGNFFDYYKSASFQRLKQQQEEL